MVIITGVKGDAGWPFFVALEWVICSTGGGLTI